MNYVETAKRAKKDSFLLSSISEGIRNSALSLICEKLRENQDYIFAANQKDLQAAEENALPSPLLSRL